MNHVLFLCYVARQLWVLSQVPWPKRYFVYGSVYSNFWYILSLRKNIMVPLEIRRSIPWIMWILWKNMNHLDFEGRIFWGPESMVKIRNDVSNLFLAQSVGSREAQNQEEGETKNSIARKPPIPS